MLCLSWYIFISRNFKRFLLQASGDDLVKNFEEALEALRTEQPTMCRMQDGIELAKGQLRAILNTINSQIETNNIINAGPFLYMNMKESPDNHMFAHPVSIRLLCKFLFALNVHF
jgi:hypothetical protein